MKNYAFYLIAVAIGITSLLSCGIDAPIPNNYQTKHIIVIVMDGPRFSETWGDSTHENIPFMANVLAPMGIVNTNFYNNGPTKTVSGHTAITTGVYQEIDNGGNEIPMHASIFQHWLADTSEENHLAWIVASKDKLEVLNNSEDESWKNLYQPQTDCGNNGLGTGYRKDSITYQRAINVLETHHPELLLVNFREPDSAGHSGDWEDYLQGIRDTDSYIHDLWNYIQNDPIYSESTTLFVTNDHGRHLDDVADGFKSHGDSCEGCRHINFYAAGPDFKENIILSSSAELVDIPATIARLLHFEMPNSTGAVMFELFK